MLVAADAAVNWESGFLNMPEVTTILTAFRDAAVGRLAGMDVTGDWSPVDVTTNSSREYGESPKARSTTAVSPGLTVTTRDAAP